MSFAPTEDSQRNQRVWQGLGALIFGEDSSAQDFIVSTRGGQVTIDTRATAAQQALPPVVTIGGYGFSWPVVALAVAAVVLAVRK